MHDGDDPPPRLFRCETSASWVRTSSARNSSPRSPLILTMSGIEVAGITLAVFPIVLNGLGRMMEGIETIKRWKKYKRELEKYAARLENAHICFSSTLTQLLDDIVPSDMDFQLMIAQPLGPLWKKPAYEESLRYRLDQSYSLYLKTIKSLADDVEKMRNKLGIDASGTVGPPRVLVFFRHDELLTRI